MEMVHEPILTHASGLYTEPIITHITLIQTLLSDRKFNLRFLEILRKQICRKNVYIPTEFYMFVQHTANTRCSMLV